MAEGRRLYADRRLVVHGFDLRHAKGDPPLGIDRQLVDENVARGNLAVERVDESLEHVDMPLPEPEFAE